MSNEQKYSLSFEKDIGDDNLLEVEDLLGPHDNGNADSTESRGAPLATGMWRRRCSLGEEGTGSPPPPYTLPQQITSSYPSSPKSSITGGKHNIVLNGECNAEVKEYLRRQQTKIMLDGNKCLITLVTPSSPATTVDIGSLEDRTGSVTTRTIIEMHSRDNPHISLKQIPDNELSTVRDDTIAIVESSSEKSENVSENGGNKVETRITWNSNIDFLLSIIGFAVDLANIWRFPYLCYKNGGGAFLIPYSLMLIFGAMPLFYMELILGQFNRQGPITIWNICPLFKGVGYCAVIIAFYVSFYYNVIIGWSFFYLISSLTSSESTLPWTDCDQPWNTPFCRTSSAIKECQENATFAQSFDHSNFSLKSSTNDSSLLVECSSMRTPATEYFNLHVLGLNESKGIFDGNTPKLELVASIFFVYTLLYLCLFKGVKSSGKVVWITALMPYVLLIVLLCRGVLLPGAIDGMKFYLIPDLSALLNPNVWIDAAIQIFYSVGAGFGVHLAYASYNKYENNCYRDCVITSIVNSCTSFFSGFVIFTYLGYMSHLKGTPIDQVAEQGPGLVFEVYPEAIATLPAPKVWASYFFVTLILLGMDSSMGGLECVITGLMDEIEAHFKGFKIPRELFTFFVVAVSFLVALSCVTSSGFYMFTLFERYAAGISLLVTVLGEAIAVSWVYGLKRFTIDVENMLGSKPSIYWRICWKFISPIFLASIIILLMLDNTPLEMQMYDGKIYTFPFEAHVLAIFITLSPVLMIPICALSSLLSQTGDLKQRLLKSITPKSDLENANSVNRELKMRVRTKSKHWLAL